MRQPDAQCFLPARIFFVGFFGAAEIAGGGLVSAGAADALAVGSVGGGSEASAEGSEGKTVGDGGFVANCVRFLIVFSGPQTATPPTPAAATATTISAKKTIVFIDRGGVAA
jgi:hypothetical protein